MLVKLLTLWGICLMAYCVLLAINNDINAKLVIILAVFVSVNIVYQGVHDKSKELAEKKSEITQTYDKAKEIVNTYDKAKKKLDRKKDRKEKTTSDRVIDFIFDHLEEKPLRR